MGCTRQCTAYLKDVFRRMDRDPLFTDAFRTMLASAGTKSVRLPALSPNLNAFAKRFVRSVRDECLSLVESDPVGRASPA
jgi:hypothetical protein